MADMTSSPHQILAQARSALFVPASRPDRFAKASASGADLVIADLEDGVSAAEKDAARGHAEQWLTSGALAVLRVNPVGSSFYAADVELVHRTRPLAVMLPKADLDSVDQLVAALGNSTPVLPLIETAQGVWQAREICARPGVARTALGTLDLAAEIGCTSDAPPIHTSADLLVLASTAAGIPGPWDGVCQQLYDQSAVGREAAAARRRGCAGKLAVHPNQLQPIHECFSPTADELSWARRVLAAVDDGVGVVDGSMVDAPVLRQARRVLRLVQS